MVVRFEALSRGKGTSDRFLKAGYGRGPGNTGIKGFQRMLPEFPVEREHEKIAKGLPEGAEKRFVKVLGLIAGRSEANLGKVPYAGDSRIPVE